jgi:aromatic ring-opening dioxygenase LigB subunit
MPHGGEVIPRLTPKGEKRFLKTTDGMRALAKKIATARPETIVIASPHNLRLVDHIGVVVAENSTGTLRTSPKRIVALKAKCDVQLAKDLLAASKAKGLPVVGANYGTFEGPTSDMAMDWGTLVPLWFALHEKRVKSRIVIVTPSREIPMAQNVEFGSVIGKILETRKGRYVFIASADQAHTHSKSGPYGFNRAAARFDKLVVEAIRADKVESLVRLDPGLVEDAKPDSPWQMAILAGILRHVPMRSTLVSYQVPTYYGMICAGFERARKVISNG